MLDHIELLNDLIVGRVEPHIYAFSTDMVPGCLKVGDTYRPVSVRLNEWRKHFPDLKEEYRVKATIDKEVFFRDYAVHQYLEQELGRARLMPADLKTDYYSREFFREATSADVADAVGDIRESYEKQIDKYQYYHAEDRLPKTHTYASAGEWIPRPNQQATIDRFMTAVKNGRKNLLMYAVMRFGKSFTALCCAKEMGARTVLVVSAKADVREEWKKTAQQADNFNRTYVFLTGEDLMREEHSMKNTLDSGKRVIVFLTLQDLQGEVIKEKHREIFENTIDLLIVDETHYGARAEKYGQVLRNNSYAKDVREAYADEDYVDYETADEKLKILKADVKLHLSGTPYRILMGSEFTKEDIIAFYQFTDIVAEQKKWDEDHGFLDDAKEWDNPYYGFPQMIRFAFHPSEAARERLKELKAGGSTYAFSALFRPKSVKKASDGSHREFVYEKEILDLFEVIDGSKEDDQLLGFLDYDKIKEGQMCRHIVCVLPYCASCDALEKLLSDHKGRFKNLQNYTIINISGVDRPGEYKSVNAVKAKIATCEEKGEKTITLTVNRMLTGSTVEQWDTMLFFKDTVSPQEYDQAVFRLQNQYIKTLSDGSGGTIKYNMKPQTLLVDFDPHRMFSMQEQKSLIYNVNTEEGGNQRLEERMKEELKISPIITINKDKMMQVEAADILKEVSAYSGKLGVMEESRDIPVDMSLLDIDVILSAVEAQAELGSKKGLQMDAYEGEESDLDDEEECETGHDDKNTGNDGNNMEEPDAGPETDRQKLENKFRMYYSRLLFYAFLSGDELKSLDDILDSLKAPENMRIARNLSLRRDVLQAIRAHINLFVLNQLDYKIQRINALSRDETIEPVERAIRAINKFGKLSESEVPTPMTIAADMVNLLPDRCILGLRRENAAILDIASKIGEFSIAIYERARELGINPEEVRSSILAVPTSSVAYEFTRKIYTVLGLDTDCIAAHFTSYDLLDIKKEDEDSNPTDDIDYDRIACILRQQKALSTIRLDDEAEEGDEMKFEAIVGNPPYQENISTNSDNSGLGKQLFPYFTILSLSCGADYTSLIIPSRWFTGDAQDKSFIKLRDFIRKNNHIKRLVNYKNENEVFQGVEIKGGVGYFLAEKDYQGEVAFTNIFEENEETQLRELFIDDMDIVINDGKDYPILKKVLGHENFMPLTCITTGRNAFGIISKKTVVERVSKEQPFAGAAKLRCMANQIRYIDPAIIQKNRDIFEKYKVFISKSAGSPKSDRKVIGYPYVGGPMSACTDSLIPIGKFETAEEAEHLASYLKTKFLRFLVSILKSSHNVTQIVYKFVPMQDFGGESDIKWNQSISDIDRQLYAKYGLSREETDYMEEKIKSVE